MKKSYVRFVGLMALAGLFMLASPAWGGGAQDSSAVAKYPSRPVSVIVGQSAGADTDFNTRLTARYLEQFLGQSFPVTNNTGNGGADAYNQVRRAAPDGYTLGVLTSPVAIAKAVGIINFGFEEYDMIAVLGRSPGEALFVRADFPANNMKEFIEYTIAHPFEVNWAANPGNTSHFVSVLANNLYGAKLNIVPSGSSVDRIAALLGGHVDAITTPPTLMRDYLERKEVKALCILTSQRVWYAPNLPTAVEGGFAELFYDNAYYLCAPKGTDPAIIKKLADACERMSKTPAYETEIKNAYSQWLFHLREKEAAQFAEKEQERYTRYSQYYKK